MSCMVQDRQVWISAGHTNVVGLDRGAFGNGFIEGELTVELRDLICKHLDEEGVEYTVDNNEHALRETIDAFQPLTLIDDLVIDIHFNSATPQATGTEVFVPYDATDTELDLAQDTAEVISNVLDIPLRGNFKGRAGVKVEGESQYNRLGWMRLEGNNILLEICFISNPEDMRKYQERKEELAYELACSISSKIGFIKKSEYNPKPLFVYTVVSGDTLSKISTKHGVSVEHIKKLNSLHSDTILIGQELKI